MNAPPEPLTNAQRVARTKEAKRAAGMIEVRSLWAYREDQEAIRKFAARLQRKREKGKP